MFRHLFFSTRRSIYTACCGVLLILAGCGVVNYISGPDVPAPTAVPTIREVVTVDGSIIVKTSGFGSGLLPQINSGIAAKLIWSDRTDSKIIEAIRIKGKNEVKWERLGVHGLCFVERISISTT